ncbi:MAG TPA: hypothetical protein VFC17_10875 [Candidatus Limnocylindrales bacterium]|nr:hypothetical protein [Candidatus Limnocylindrales bacterium]
MGKNQYIPWLKFNRGGDHRAGHFRIAAAYGADDIRQHAGPGHRDHGAQHRSRALFTIRDRRRLNQIRSFRRNFRHRYAAQGGEGHGRNGIAARCRHQPNHHDGENARCAQPDQPFQFHAKQNRHQPNI